MTPSIRKPVPTPLDWTIKDNNPAKNIKASILLGRQEDVVTLSSGGIDAAKTPAKLKPSQPVTHSEMQALQSPFSIYG